MAKPKQTSQKSDREKKKRLKQKEKEEKRVQRKASSNKGKGFEQMLAYIDHNGRITDTPPDPKLKVEVKAEDILIGARSFITDKASEIKTGRVAIFNSERNFGFIKDSLSQEKVFFHVSDTNYSVSEGDLINYELSFNPKGSCAVNISKQN